MKPLFLLVFSVIMFHSFGQNPVISFQKINETNGGFNYSLNNSDYFGFSCDSIGDLDKDGTTDIIVGAWGDDHKGVDKGAVYILFLNPDGTVKAEQKISDGEGNFAGVLNEGDVFGRSVSSIGDFNGDGVADVAAGAEYDSDAGYRHGAFYILFLDTTGKMQSYDKINEFDFNVSLPWNACFGSDIANIGDINGDGGFDFVVGARRDVSFSGEQTGAVWILFFDPDGTIISSQKINEGEGGFSGSLDAEDYFGASVANIGDLDNDGINDIVVGAVKDDDGGSNFGAVYVIFLKSNGTVKNYQKICTTEGNFSGVLNENSYFGSWVAAAGDINNDQTMDILVGAPGDHTNGIWSGGFYLLNLNTNGTVKSYQFYTEGINGFCGILIMMINLEFQLRQLVKLVIPYHF